jgi:hypothetical protein
LGTIWQERLPAVDVAKEFQVNGSTELHDALLQSVATRTVTATNPYATGDITIFLAFKVL